METNSMQQLNQIRALRFFNLPYFESCCYCLCVVWKAQREPKRQFVQNVSALILLLR